MREEVDIAVVAGWKKYMSAVRIRTVDIAASHVSTGRVIENDWPWEKLQRLNFPIRCIRNCTLPMLESHEVPRQSVVLPA